MRRMWLASVLASSALIAPGIAHAQTEAERIRALESRLEAQDARIAELERLLNAKLAAPAASAPAAVAAAPQTGPIASTVLATVPAPSATTSRLDVSGDFRLRQEFNWSDADGRDRSRSVLRARLRASYAVNDIFTVGAQLSTGDPDDPNSTDMTLGEFVDDLNVSLDQAYVRAKVGDLTVTGGKFANPFRRTDLVWDGDVSPQGVAAAYSTKLGDAKLDVRAMYFLVNEVVAGRGSDMLGGQLGITAPIGDWSAELAAGYYDYRLRSVAGSDAGDLRSNLLRPNGTYLSDFNLGNVIAGLIYKGLGAQWPVGLVGEYVHNYGAAVDADDGYSVELFAGRASSRGDWRLGYNYAVAENDAVLAAFGQDNFGLATNYRLHALSLDHVVYENTILNLTLYHYRPKDPLYAGTNQPDDWLNRLRVNLLFNF
ncbi:putative porin [Sphingoaurantiacus capsulatus]|uniref:Porin n=1 Tax=Sphingoaurantiacus capsulatus TaxID=1771310 RepID=A0ABV7XCJ8_9SPHN